MDSRENSSPLQRTGPGVWGVWLGVLLAFSLLYILTAQRGWSWQDHGEYQWRVLTGDYDGPGGLVRSHPLYIALGRTIVHVPLGSVGMRITCLSAIGTALTLANLGAIVILLTGKRWIAVATASMVGVMHTVWWLSTMAKEISLSTAALTAEIWLLILLIRKPSWKLLAGLALVSGLDWSVHNFALLPLPVYLVAAVALIARRKLPAWSLAAAGAAFLCGASAYIMMIVQDLARTGDLAGTLASALYGRYGGQVLNVSAPTRNVGANAALSAMNFVNLVVPLAVVGWLRLRKRVGSAIAAAIGAITIIEILFFARYSVDDQFLFITPSLLMIAVAAAVGVATLSEISRRWRIAAICACVFSTVASPLFCALAPGIARRMNAIAQRPGHERDEARYFLVPWKQCENSADEFARKAVHQAEPNGVIVAHSTAYFPLLLEVRQANRGDLIVQSASDLKTMHPPLPIKAKDPRELRVALGDRPLYDVTDSYKWSCLSSEVFDALTFSRDAGQVLYRATWK